GRLRGVRLGRGAEGGAGDVRGAVRVSRRRVAGGLLGRSLSRNGLAVLGLAALLGLAVLGLALLGLALLTVRAVWGLPGRLRGRAVRAGSAVCAVIGCRGTGYRSLRRRRRG